MTAEHDCWAWLLSMTAGLCAKDMFSLERNRWAITQSGCYDFATPPTITESSCGSTSLTKFGIVSVLGLGHSNSKQWYLIDGLICNYLMTYDAEHLFIWIRLKLSCLENSMNSGSLWATVHGVAKSWTWLSDFGSWLMTQSHGHNGIWLISKFRSFAYFRNHFLNVCFLIAFLLLSKNCFFWIEVPHQTRLWQISPPILWFALILLILSFAEHSVAILMKSSLLIIYFLDHVFGVLSKRSLPYPWSF